MKNVTLIKISIESDKTIFEEEIEVSENVSLNEILKKITLLLIQYE